jgi:hypothetical protein
MTRKQVRSEAAPGDGSGLDSTGSDRSGDALSRFRHLPDRVPVGELIAEQPTADAPDPDALVEPTGDWMHRPH